MVVTLLFTYYYQYGSGSWIMQNRDLSYTQAVDMEIVGCVNVEEMTKWKEWHK